MGMLIPHSQPTISPEDIHAVCDVFKTGQLAQGKKVFQFEQQLAGYIGRTHAAATNSGTSALHLALLALGVKRKDEVILPTYVCTALLNAVNYTGATVCLADVRRDDFNISVEDVKKRINRKTKVIIVPHMFGMPADLGALLKLDVPFIEDCAQALGATYNGRPVGSFGVMSIFSFYATKVLTTGEGGMVASSNRRLIEKVKDLREYDKKRNYERRYNYKMTNFQAALGLSQLAKLPSFIAQRKRIAKNYHEGIDRSHYELPAEFKGRESIYFHYVVKTKRPQMEYVRRLKKGGICCSAPVYKPLHQYLKQNRKFPEAEWLWKHAFSIPIYPTLSRKDVLHIIACLNETVKPT